MHIIEICKFINKIIFNDLDIQSKINDKIFQLIQKNGTDKPFIVTSRGTVSSTATKDKRIDNSVLVHIDIYTLKYTEGIELQILIDKAVTGSHIIDNERFTCIIDEFSESFSDDSFVQSIVINVLLS